MMCLHESAYLRRRRKVLHRGIAGRSLQPLEFFSRDATGTRRWHTVTVMRDLLISFAFGVLFALPWIGAAVWISWRVGWRVMWSESGKLFPTQATSLRSFSLR